MKDSRIDDTNHTRLAMFALRAVEPDRLGIIHHDGVKGHHGRVLRYWHEAGEEALDIRHRVGNRQTWRIKGRLDDGVVLVPV